MRYGRDPVLGRAISFLGGLRATGKALGVSFQAVGQWNRVPARWAIPLEAATGGKITRYEIRPDIFGPPPEAGP